MTTRSRIPGAGFESMSYSTDNSLPDQQVRRGSLPEEMTTIVENNEEDFADTRPFAKSAATVTITEPVSPSLMRAPSMFRRLTTKLRSSGTLNRTRTSARRHYANVQDNESDYIGVDLSSLEGLGFQLKEVTNAAHEHALSTDQDISYDEASSEQSSTLSPNVRKPEKRRTIGDGLVVGMQLQRDPSVIEHISRNKSLSSADNPRRMKTVRQVAQDLAEDRGQIIAFDISSLEGTGLTQRQSTTFDGMSIGQDKKSYYFPTEPRIPNWKPFSMRPPYIVMLISIALGLAGFQEYLCQTSIRRQSETPKSGLLVFNSVVDVSDWWFFVWKYLPTIITISYSVLFSIMDFDVRRLESWHQLSRPQGSRAAASLNLDHMTMFQYFIPFKAARLGQWTVCVSTIANIVAATIAPALQNPAVNFEENPDTTCGAQGCADGGKRFWVVISPVWSRLLSASYVFVGLCAIVLLFRLRRKSGLLSDPKGIAGIAAMATKSHILQDFRGLDLATRADIHKRLAHRTYILYKSSIWQGEWTKHKESPVETSHRLRSPHPIMLRLTAGIPFIGIMICCLAAVPIISLTPARVIPNAVPWLPILVATVLKLIWSTFESVIYGWMPIRAALNGHFILALVGLSSVCLDVFSVTIGSFSVDSAVFLKVKDHNGEASQDETFISFVVSLALSVVILIFVICVTILVYACRRHPFLPREPSTIAAVLAFIYNSKMLTDFIDTELLDGKSMEARLKNLNKRYALAWFRGRDGEVRCAIDEEPAVSRYVHGKPYSDAVAGPMEHGSFYYP